jgi:hypothetical protein
MHRAYPSSLAAWLCKYLPDGSSERDGKSRLDIPDDKLASWTDGTSPNWRSPGSRSPGSAGRLVELSDSVVRKGLRGREVLEGTGRPSFLSRR